MSQLINIQPPNLTSYQKAIIYSEARFTITEASTKSGKTFSHLWWLFELACKAPRTGQNFWWVAPVYNQSRMAYDRLKKQLNDNGAMGLFKANETNLTIKTPNGSIITFKSAEKPDNLYGDDVYGVVFDEATRAREQAFFALRSTLTKSKGKMKLIGNSKGKKNWVFILGAKARAGEPNYEYHKITAYDAVREGVIDLEEVEQAKRDLPEHVFKELYMAEPMEDAANPFGQEFIEFCSFQHNGMSLEPAVCYGVDLAKYVDWTVIVGLDRNGYVCCFERFRKDWKQTTETIAKRIGNVRTRIDSTGVGDPIVEELQRKSPNVEGLKYTQHSKQQLMEGLAVAFQQRQIMIPRGVLKDECESFEFKSTRTGVVYSAPDGLHDDAVNALALAWSIWTKASTYGRYLVS